MNFNKLAEVVEVDFEKVVELVKDEGMVFEQYGLGSAAEDPVVKLVEGIQNGIWICYNHPRIKR